MSGRYDTLVKDEDMRSRLSHHAIGSFLTSSSLFRWCILSRPDPAALDPVDRFEGFQM